MTSRMDSPNTTARLQRRFPFWDEADFFKELLVSAVGAQRAPFAIANFNHPAGEPRVVMLVGIQKRVAHGQPDKVHLADSGPIVGFPQILAGNLEA